MEGRLKFLTVSDFRSISGPVAVSLDAPVVLIHGPNGTGKTSLLSAIELGLTGAVPSLARFDDEYLAHLPHKLSKDGKAYIGLQADGGVGGQEVELIADGSRIVGNGLLGPDHARFYTERCYLAQATLGRLLEIYEHQDSRKTDSPLTRFVKEMLGLEALDELIEGLHAAGDVRRFRESAPLFWSARADAPKLDDSVVQAMQLEQALRDESGRLEARLRELAGPLIAEDDPIEPGPVRPRLADLVGASETRLLALARIRRDISGASSQVREAAVLDAGGERLRAEQASVTARDALTSWQSGPSRPLETLIEAIRKTFPEVPPASSDPAASHLAASQAVRTALARDHALAAADDTAAQQLSEVRVAIRQGQGRIDQIDQELANAQGANKELAEALTAIAGHIHDEHCPVCGRDYSEISPPAPLAAHISEEVARLVTAAGRVEALIRDRTATAVSLTAAQRREADIESKRPPAERRDSLKSELATLSEWMNSLETSSDVAATGSQLIRDAAQTAQAVSLLNSRESSLSGLRAELATHAAQLALPPWPVDVPLQIIIDGLTAAIERQTEEETRRKSAGEQALETLVTLSDVRQRLLGAERRHLKLQRQQALSASRRAESERRIAVARDLVARAQAVRGDEVRRVFNEELNAVWRELFIRLAPDEAFVPAFALPEVAGRPVEAMLETVYRSGGKGGNPRAMLSAGNLNTAALTLFLALHLSAPPVLPWLVIDDPVQSMDDVHIAQLAALLRTLKQHGKQVIIAVHDRQLFDYLALELSPAFNGDRLVTIELGRNADSLTTAQWSLASFEPDRAIAA
jgi:DNA repair protein SbcC/Rad50